MYRALLSSAWTVAPFHPVRSLPMSTSPLTRDRHGRRFTVTITREGWAVREERDSLVVRNVTYTDWHRVERAMQLFEQGRGDDRYGGSADGADAGRHLHEDERAGSANR
jgi:hypothetical protein